MGLGCVWRGEGQRGPSRPKMHSLLRGLLHVLLHVRWCMSWTLL